MRVLLLLTATITFNTFAQVGPGGIENTSGSSDMIMWLDANAIEGVTHFGNITTWEDLSGYGNDASQSNSTNKPNLLYNHVNGMPVVRFNGIERLEGNFGNLTSPLTVIAVAYFDSISENPGEQSYVFSIGSQNLSNSMANIARKAGDDATNPNTFFNYDGTNLNHGPTITGQQWDIFQHSHNNASPYHELLINNSSQVIEEFMTTPLNTNGDFRIADWADSPGGAYHLKGKIAEIIVFRRNLIEAETNILNNYLSAKYDISINNDLYAGDQAGNGHNDFDVIGIGTEASGSHTTSHAAGMTIIQNSGYTNGEYLIAGHATEENSINTTDVGGGYAARWDRTWYYDLTGTHNNNIHFDLSRGGLGGNLGVTNTDYALVYRAGTSGAWTTIATASSLTGDKVIFTNVALTNDGHYTLATLDNTNSPIGTSPTSTICYGPGGIETPDGTNDLVLWLDPTAMNGVDDDQIASFNDFSGYEHHADQLDVNNIPVLKTNVVNGMDVARFNGFGHAEGNFTSALGSPSTIIAVGYFNNDQGAGDNDYLFSTGDPTTANQNTSIGRRRDGINQYYSWDGGTAHLGPYINTAEWNAFYQENTTTGNFHNLYMNGASQAVPAYGSAFSATSTVFRVAEWQNENNSALDGDIGEIIVFDRLLNSAERNIINSYLGAKFDLTITDDKYTGDDAANDDNDLYVAGIGTEADGSNTCASSSGLSLDIDANFDVGDYVLFGHNVETNSVNTADIALVSGTIDGRWDRAWWWDITDGGSALSVDVTFDYSENDINSFPNGSPADYKLLYRATNSGNWTVVASADNISGDQVIFSNYTPTNGDGYYTLASVDLFTNPLPVQLIAFDAEVLGTSIVDAKVKLNWATASEFNNDFFTIQKSLDGLAFENLGNKDGAGFSNTIINYDYIDEEPAQGISFYRLKQTDFNGNTAYSNVESVNIDGLEIIDLYPNPAQGQITFHVASSFEGSINVYISNVVGQRIYSTTKTVGKQIHEFTLSTTELPTGYYFLEVISDDGQYAKYKQFIVNQE